MGREVHIAVLILLSIFEVWMCYQVLYRTVLDKKYLRTWQKVLIWGNILGVGILLGINRSMLFFSHTVFYISLLFTAIFICCITKKDRLIKGEIVALYFTSLALLDFFSAFMSMVFIGENFYNTIYKFSGEGIQTILFLFPRGFILCLLIKWKDLTQEIRDYKKWLFFLCVVLLVLLREYQVTLATMAVGMNDMRGLAAAISMLVVFSVVAGIFALSHHFKILKKENEMLFVREELSKRHLEEMEKLMEQHRIQIHDIKKHLLILSEYGKEQDWESLLRYLNEISNEMNLGKKTAWTHVRILDMILNQEKEKAEKFQIEFQIQETVVGVLPFTDIEICALFGNLLDNAIEACCKIKYRKKWIAVKLLRKSEMLYIVISNSIETKPEKKNGKLVSDKTDKEVHGYGLKSVQKIIKKYNGEIEYQIKKEEFTVKIAFFLL